MKPNFVNETGVLLLVTNCDHYVVNARLSFKSKIDLCYKQLIWQYDKLIFIFLIIHFEILTVIGVLNLLILPNVVKPSLFLFTLPRNAYVTRW